MKNRSYKLMKTYGHDVLPLCRLDDRDTICLVEVRDDWREVGVHMRLSRLSANAFRGLICTVDSPVRT